ncbi:hypothetical protein [Pedobacter sp. B4-66]|uniref:hypothetical protein n=1 Tax=Pedobacter sp. B4-66 TaxID=2817280 RepID=UPI001BDB2CA9|nr:hypothetical protein [Pedobacter sp. B4-66]
MTDKADIPYEMVRKLEVMFNMEIGALINQETYFEDLKNLMINIITLSGCYRLVI